MAKDKEWNEKPRQRGGPRQEEQFLLVTEAEEKRALCMFAVRL